MPTILDEINRRRALAEQGLPANTPTAPAGEVMAGRIRAARPSTRFRGPKERGGRRAKIGYAGG